MSMPFRRIGVPLLLLTMTAACAPSDGPQTTASPSTASTGSIPTTTLSARGGPVPICATEDVRFALDGNAGTVDSSQSDAATLAGITWFSTGECDRLSISFSSASGAPALDPPVAAAVMIRRLGIVRISLGSSVVDSTVFDQAIDTEFAESLYVVRDPAGALFVDIHLAAAAEARLVSSTAPGLLSIDFREGGDPYPSTPVRSGRAVLIEPTTGVLAGPIIASGYRFGPGSLEPRLVTATGSALTAEDDPVDDPLWRTFAYVFGDPPPGPAQIVIGDQEMGSIDITG